MSEMSDLPIEISETLSEKTGITYEQAAEIVRMSKVVNADNWRGWIEDIRRVCELDTINA